MESKHSFAMSVYLQCVNGTCEQLLSISVPLIVWSGDTEGSTAQGEFGTFSNRLRFWVDGDVRLTLPV